MSFETRTILYLYTAAILSAIIVAIIILGIFQQWKPEQFAGVISSTVTAGSITFLVMDKVLFDKPNFQIFVDENTREEPVSTKDHKERSLAIIVRNTGFRDAYSVRTNVHLLTPDFKIRNIIPSKETQMIKIGEDREWLLPISVLTYSKEETDYSAGWIRVEVLSALSRRYYFFYYKIEKMSSKSGIHANS